ncbi:MAG: DnaD domain protein [Bacilli bacterium]|jgi:DNA replication protein|nr:DnaD domain protein [Bacilli bacterium]
MNEVVFKTLKEKDFIIKNFLIKVALELKLSLNETILLVYFMNQEEPTLNIENITSNVYLNEEEIMQAYSRLIGINLVTVKVIKKENGMRKEIISLDNIIRYVTTDITKKHATVEKENLFDVFEREFGRTLSTMEFEIINEWMDSGFSKELILEALKESIYDGYRSLKSISTKLEYWKEKGYKNRHDINKGLKEEAENTLFPELFDTNWLDDDE